jgi:hypothetical protein
MHRFRDQALQRLAREALEPEVELDDTTPAVNSRLRRPNASALDDYHGHPRPIAVLSVDNGTFCHPDFTAHFIGSRSSRMLHVSVAEVPTAEVSGHSLEILIAKVRRHKLPRDGGYGLELLISERERRHRISSRDSCRRNCPQRRQFLRGRGASTFYRALSSKRLPARTSCFYKNSTRPNNEFSDSLAVPTRQAQK